MEAVHFLICCPPPVNAQLLYNVATMSEAMSPSVMDEYVAYWQQRRVEQRARSQELARQARLDAVKIAAMLRRDFGVTRVILFGSLVNGRFFPGSDIDLAVAGLAKEELFRALACAGQVSEFQVDLKPLEELEPHFKERVLTTGQELYRSYK